MSIEQTIQQQINDHPVVLYMKGTVDFPQCGFSGQVAAILQQHGVRPYDVNVLADPDIRAGIKTFSNWPTIPQLYIKGEFVGGCDIVSELHDSGELAELFEQAGVL